MMATEVAAQFYVGTIDDFEFACHRLVIGYTFGVGTTNDACKSVGKHNGTLLDNSIVADNIDYSSGCNDGNAVEHTLVEFCVGYFNNAFSDKTSAMKVVSDSHAFGNILYSKYSYGGEKRFRLNMVYYRAVSQCSNGEFFLISGHFGGI